MKLEEAIKELKEMQESYQDEIGKCSGLLDEQWQEYTDVCNLSIQALEKQVAKKPIDIHNRAPLIVIYCPECEQVLTDEYGGRYEYCPDCGQAIDWSESDE